MPRGKKSAIIVLPTLNYAFNKQCTSCGFMFSKKDGRPVILRPLMAILWAPVVVARPSVCQY